MKILFLTNIPSPYRVDFFNELGNLCDLTVLYERHDAKDREANWLTNKAISFKEIYLNGINVGNDSAICCSVIKWLKDRSFDLVVVGGYSTPTGMLSIEYMKLKRIPFILNSDGGLLKKESKFRYCIKKHFLSSALAWLSTAKVTDEYLLYYGAKKEKIYRYPFTSIKKEDILNKPLDKEEKIIIKDKLNISYDKMIISVGQFIFRKGFDVLLKACNKLGNDVGIYIIGGDPTEEYLELIQKYGLNNVHFEDFKAKEELSEYYKAADLFVLPTREDIWGLVVNEAMAYGLPVITTDKCVAGLELIEDSKNGYIVAANEDKELSKRMNLIINDMSLSKDMAFNNLSKINKYTIENMAKDHIEFFRKEFGDI